MGDTGGRDGGGAASGEGSSNFNSYIGSLISLTSKSDIRYEGILYTIDAENCNIALQNVRSYGTEGRKKELPIPPKDSVYDYIIFRGSDIKDLQVKSSPPAYTDPAIIAHSQQQKQRIPTSAMPSPLGIPPPAGMPQVPGYSHAPVIPHPPVQPRESQGLLPPGFVNSSYPQVGLSAWGPRPPPVGNGPMPMYWSGYYPPGGQPPYIPSQQPQQPQPPLLAPERPTQKPDLGSSSQPLHPPPVSDGMDKVQTAMLTPIATRLPRVSQALETSPADVKKDVEQKPVEASGELAKTSESPKPEPSPTSNERQANAKPGRVENARRERVENARYDHVRSDHVRNDNNGRHPWRGNGRRGGRGRGFYYRSTQNFTEDFDFTAMNEKFNKDEVWDELGKNKNTEEDEIRDNNAWQKKLEDAGKSPVYVKDDFFDSLSCDALDREGGHNDRPRFSEQRKINTETFGDAFLRSRNRGNYRGGYGNRGGSYRRGGRSHQTTSV